MIPLNAGHYSHNRRAVPTRRIEDKRSGWKAILADTSAPVWERIKAALVLGRTGAGWAIVCTYLRNEDVPVEERVLFAKTVGYVVKRKPRGIILYHDKPLDRHVIKLHVH